MKQPPPSVDVRSVLSTDGGLLLRQERELYAREYLRYLEVWALRDGGWERLVGAYASLQDLPADIRSRFRRP